MDGVVHGLYRLVRFGRGAEADSSREVDIRWVRRELHLRMPAPSPQRDAKVEDGGADTDIHLAAVRIDRAQLTAPVHEYIDAAVIDAEQPRLRVVHRRRSDSVRDAVTLELACHVSRLRGLGPVGQGHVDRSTGTFDLWQSVAVIIRGSLKASEHGKGWFAGPWNSHLPIAAGWADRGVNLPHRHDLMYEIYFNARGESIAVVAGQTIHLRSGDMLAVEPGEAHTFISSTDDYLHFVVQAPFVGGDKTDLDSA